MLSLVNGQLILGRWVLCLERENEIRVGVHKESSDEEDEGKIVRVTIFWMELVVCQNLGGL